jgi:hypothetical protein
MNTTDNDSELRKLIKKVKIESPDPDFSSRVMDVILARAEGKKVFSSEPVLGRSFWILVTLFVLLTVAFILLSGNTIHNEGIVQNLLSGLPAPDFTTLKNSLAKFMEISGSLPLSVAVTMIAASVLILADKFFTTKQKMIPG